MFHPFAGGLTIIPRRNAGGMGDKLGLTHVDQRPGPTGLEWPGFRNSWLLGKSPNEMEVDS